MDLSAPDQRVHTTLLLVLPLQPPDAAVPYHKTLPAQLSPETQLIPSATENRTYLPRIHIEKSDWPALYLEFLLQEPQALANGVSNVGSVQQNIPAARVFQVLKLLN